MNTDTPLYDDFKTPIIKKKDNYYDQSNTKSLEK